MLVNETIGKMKSLKLYGMAGGYEEIRMLCKNQNMSSDEMLADLIDREQIDRFNRATHRRIKTAKLRESALIEDIDWHYPRKLDQSAFKPLISSDWLTRHQNVVFVGPTGVGKTWLACALAQKACEDGFTTRYYRLPRLLGNLSQSRGDGSYERLLKLLSNTNLIILDDWGQSLSELERRDIREIIEERFDRGSLILTTQTPINRWHDLIGDPTIGDAIVDRIVNKAHIFELSGDSMRRKKQKAIQKPLPSESSVG